MITGIHISQEIFANDVLTALKSSLEQRRKYVLQLLRLYGDQVLEVQYHELLHLKPTEVINHNEITAIFSIVRFILVQS